MMYRSKLDWMRLFMAKKHISNPCDFTMQRMPILGRDKNSCHQKIASMTKGDRARFPVSVFVILLVITLLAATQSNSTLESTIVAAVLPLPESLRKGATVVRLNGANQPEVIR